MFLVIFLNLTILFDANYNMNSNPFVGHWKAQWSMSKNSQFVLSSDKSSLMYGFFSFEKEGSVSIKGFGYPDCLFSEDTISYNTNWFTFNNQLFIGNNEENKFNYNIQSIKNNEIKLILLDDISLILTK
tara:strand:- start:37 stop:423 length:387 start_codon:yes stop_codon:yes gene_type:complete